jgi:hypothetical protein
LAAVSAWATGQRYEPSAVSTFLQVADYYLVAQSNAAGHTVVTHEIPLASTRRIKIPDACIGLGIKCMTPFEMLRRERDLSWGAAMTQTNEAALETCRSTEGARAAPNDPPDPTEPPLSRHVPGRWRQTHHHPRQSELGAWR